MLSYPEYKQRVLDYIAENSYARNEFTFYRLDNKIYSCPNNIARVGKARMIFEMVYFIDPYSTKGWLVEGHATSEEINDRIVNYHLKKRPL